MRGMRWTTDEVRILREHASKGSVTLAALIPRHSTEAIRCKAYELRISLGEGKPKWRRWSEAEDAALKAGIRDRRYDWDALERDLSDRTRTAIKMRAHALGIAICKPGRNRKARG